MKPSVFERFVKWRDREHRYEVIWMGKKYAHTSPGVKGETISRNLDDLRAAFKHNEKMTRIKAPYVPPVPSSMRSKPRDLTFTMDELGAIFGYAQQASETLYQPLALILATAVRTEAALAFDPVAQVRGAAIDLHPPAWQRTKKVNPIVPMIPELLPVLDNWRSASVRSRKTAWNTMSKLLELNPASEFKTIRHTIATILLDMSMSDSAGDLAPMHIEGLLGHRVLHRTSSVYAKWGVRHLEPVRPALSLIWKDVHDAAQKWSAGHLLNTPQRGQARKVTKTTTWAVS